MRDRERPRLVDVTTDATRTARPPGVHPLIGMRLPGGRCALPAYACQLWNAAAGLADPIQPAGEVDPMMAQYLVMCAGGSLVDQILELVSAGEEVGVMVGEIDLEPQASLRTNGEYDVVGEITGYEHREGRRIETFDTISFAHEVRAAADGALVATVGQTWIVFPQGISTEGSA